MEHGTQLEQAGEQDIGAKNMVTAKRKPLKNYTLDVLLILARKSGNADDRHEMTEHRIGVNLYKYAPAIIATTGMKALDADYATREVRAFAKVRASTSDRAIDTLVTKLNRLDGVYGLRRVRVKLV